MLLLLLTLIRSLIQRQLLLLDSTPAYRRFGSLFCGTCPRSCSVARHSGGELPMGLRVLRRGCFRRPHPSELQDFVLPRRAQPPRRAISFLRSCRQNIQRLAQLQATRLGSCLGDTSWNQDVLSHRALPSREHFTAAYAIRCGIATGSAQWRVLLRGFLENDTFLLEWWG